MHYHIYLAADSATPPPAFALATPYGFRSRSSANRVAAELLDDPARRLVRQCDNPDCDVLDGAFAVASWRLTHLADYGLPAFREY